MGISGHLRVINGELTLEACIDSCLPFVDELIITYQSSKDKTEEILQKYAQQYPNKIKLYYYEPFVVSSSARSVEWGTEEEKKRNTDPQYRKSDNIHNSANYYNYGYTKISYCYYMKIDADQIYFTEKMIQVRKGLVFPLNKSNKLTRFLFKVICKINNKLQLTQYILKHCSYSLYVILLRIIHLDEKLAYILGGIETYLNHGTIGFSMEKKHNPFNGFSGDTCIWVPSSQERYYQVEGQRYEAINIAGGLVPVGFAWIHIGYILTHLDKCEREGVLTLHTADVIKSFEELSYTPYQNIQDLLVDKHQYLAEWIRAIRLNDSKKFWDNDKKYFSQSLYLTMIEQKLQKIIM